MFDASLGWSTNKRTYFAFRTQFDVCLSSSRTHSVCHRFAWQLHFPFPLLLGIVSRVRQRSTFFANTPYVRLTNLCASDRSTDRPSAPNSLQIPEKYINWVLNRSRRTILRLICLIIQLIPRSITFICVNSFQYDAVITCRNIMRSANAEKKP